jgi:capsular polysaccharide biosynthesis protein
MERMSAAAEPGSPLLAQLRRRWMLILATTVVCAVAAFAIAQTRDETFTAQTALLVSQSSPEATILGAAVPQDSGTQGRSTTTIATVANARPVAERTAQTLRGRLTAAAVQDQVSVAPSADANVLQVTATDTTPAAAAQLANAFAAEVVAVQSERVLRSAQTAREALARRYADLSPARRRSADGQDLRVQIQRLRTLELVGARGLSVIEPAQAPAAGNSSVVRTTLLGLLFGLLLGGGLALLREQLDHRVRPEDDLERLLGLPVLGEVPESRDLAGAVPMGQLAPAAAEPFRMLWSRLRYGPFERPVRRVLLTSAGTQDGKSLVAWYLASAAAASGARVLLIEADARQPVLAERHHLPPAPGLLGLLDGGADLAGAVARVDAPGQGALDVLAAREPGDTLTRLDATDRLVGLLSEEVMSYDLVVVDAPPIRLAAEAIPLSTAVDGVLVVARSSRSTREGLREVLGELTRLQAPVLGAVRCGGARKLDYGDAELAVA